MSIKSVNPYTGELIKEYESFSNKNVDEILITSEKVFSLWRESKFTQRRSLLASIAARLRNEKVELAQLMTTEMGKPYTQGLAEVEKCAWVCDFYAENGERFLEDKVIKTDASHSFVKHEALGTILAIMPWNFPFWQVFRFVAPALMAGNTMVLKHASNVSGCALKIEEILLESGLPKHVFRTLILPSSSVQRVIENPIIKAVTLTGSEAAGISVASTAGANIKSCLLELGGSNAFIVLDDADIEKAVNDAIIGRFLNNGQSCIAAKRILIHEDVYDDFVGRFTALVKDLWIGDPMDEQCYIGPLARKDLAEELHEQVERSIALGAKLSVGGRFQNAMYSPSILSDVKPGMPAFDEETFGPVAALTKIRNLSEGIELSNRSKFGLGVSIYTSSPELILEKSHLIEDGALFINSFVKSDPRLPFGGTKMSGFGRELSEEGIKEFVNTKTVFVS